MSYFQWDLPKVPTLKCPLFPLFIHLLITHHWIEEREGEEGGGRGRKTWA